MKRREAIAQTSAFSPLKAEIDVESNWLIAERVSGG